MKKAFALLAALICLAVSLVAQQQEQNLQQQMVANPRYKNVALGVYGMNQYGLAGWEVFAPITAGAGLDLEYTLPSGLKKLDLGFALHGVYSHVFPKEGSTLAQCEDISAIASFWLRVPFSIGMAHFAFQPEIGYGVVFHYAQGQNGSSASGWYIDQVLSLAPAFRWIPNGADFMEVELAPLYTFSPEKSGYMLNQMGFRAGIIWHFQRAD